MQKFKIALFSFYCILTFNLFASNGKKTLYVNDHKVNCAGSFKCLEIKEKAKGEWIEFSDTIQGFDYQEGYKYTLQVEVAEARDPYAGRITDKYRLVRILSKTKTNYQPAEEQLEHKKFILLTLFDGSKTLTMKDSGAFIELNIKDGRLTGHGVCNSFNGAVKFEGNSVKISGIMSTKVFCRGVELEGVITKFLCKATSWLREDGILTLRCADGSELTFRAEAIN
jgi:heat shock protein HslJ